MVSAGPSAPSVALVTVRDGDRHLRESKLHFIHDVSPDGSRLPTKALEASARLATSLLRCVSNGMQQKCFFRNLQVQRNQFTFCGGDGSAAGGFPNPMFLPDGQPEPLIQHHQYRGHRVDVTGRCTCERVVDRPAVFLFRMSGHSTYHLWENNLGPFFQTLEDFRNDVKPFHANLESPSDLIVVIGDQKPTAGPKAPHLLDQLLRTFTDVPLINASRILTPVCFRLAIVGVSASSFSHRALVSRMLRYFAQADLDEDDGNATVSRNREGGLISSTIMPTVPRCLFISRNHPSVIRGRKIANEAAAVDALNRTLIAETGRALEYVQFETMSYREQVLLAADSQIMFSPHGGGVAQCIWMKPGSVMVEFVAPVGKTLLNMYRAMCGKSKVAHISFLADADPADLVGPKLDNPRLFSNMIVPPERLVIHAKKALAKYAEAANRRPRG